MQSPCGSTSSELIVGAGAPADIELSQLAGTPLQLQLEADLGALYNIEAVKHPDQLEYSYLR